MSQSSRFQAKKPIASNPRLPRLALIAALVALATVGVAVAEQHTVNTSSGLTAQGAPLALRGYDPVSYFTEGKAELGSAAHAVAHDGATYRFVSERHQQRFEANPARYLPQYGGFCAYGVSVGAKFDGDPEVWKVVDGKLYLNLNTDIQQLWDADTGAAIRKADGQWRSIHGADPATLKPQG